MSATSCCVCGKALTGGLDTYGEQGLELCESCRDDLYQEIESVDPTSEGWMTPWRLEDFLWFRKLTLRQVSEQQMTLDGLLPVKKAKGWVF